MQQSNRDPLFLARLCPQEELGVRPVVVAGEYGSLTSTELADAPSVSTSGAFGNFRIDAAGSASEWVVSCPAADVDMQLAFKALACDRG